MCSASNLFVVLSFSKVGAILLVIISSHISEKAPKISAFDSIPKALSITEIGNFLFLYIFTFIIHLFSISISNQDHFAGITFREYHSSHRVKNTQVLLTIWFTITLSIQFIIKVAMFVIRGIPHI